MNECATLSRVFCLSVPAVPRRRQAVRGKEAASISKESQTPQVMISHLQARPGSQRFLQHRALKDGGNVGRVSADCKHGGLGAGIGVAASSPLIPDVASWRYLDTANRHLKDHFRLPVRLKSNARARACCPPPLF
jgi:hypothetical protein